MTESNQRILVVDDEAPIRRYLRAALSAQGFTIYEAASGQEALNAVIANRPDVIILDLGLPDIDGIEVTRQLRAWSQTPPSAMARQPRNTGRNTRSNACGMGAWQRS